MDIMGADDMKWTMRIIAKFAQKKLESDYKQRYGVKLEKGQTFIDYVHNDLKMCTNPGIRKIYNQILQAGQGMPTDYHSSTICDLGAFMLWTMYKDTAYRDPFFWVLDNLMKDKDFSRDIHEFVKPPQDWYCPRWIESKKKTAQMRKDNEIGVYDLSSEEKRFVPSIQQNEINNMLKQEIERQKQRRV